MSPGQDSAAPLVTVVVVNFNGGKLILKCLWALHQQTYRNFNTVVVDNASTDGSREEITHLFPEVRVVAAKENLGFAKGVNLALSGAIRSEWFALVNPDASPEPGWLEALLTATGEYPEIVAFGSCLLQTPESPDNPPTIDGTGDVYHVSGLVWRRGHGRRWQSSDAQPREIFAPCAAAALYRTDAVRSVGGFDDALFCYLEDVDLGFRLRLAGKSCRYVPAAVAYHQGSAIAGFHSDFQTYHSHRNVVRVFVKNMPGALFWLFMPLHLLMNGVTLVLLALQGRGCAAWRAKRDALNCLSQTWQARTEVQAMRQISPFSLLRQLSWNPMRRWPI